MIAGFSAVINTGGDPERYTVGDQREPLRSVRLNGKDSFVRTKITSSRESESAATTSENV